ncbi:nuclear transport factor 2 family protein [Pimelobacter simplex]|uniref:nuclear transport factor 2 family protein n=1 Tax=Nocardioides simplex TaxID=2045 RepID=UPI00214FDBC6|nr:nuclear transport factor 2 family protein [Pimelobacter simplex]UUW87288.1 nuclear transport factor 2 family protein [Pimelobacter simplex]UUW96794.1 nuclear transport factor 2 family protein [Pimelobacter simplex]
MPVPVTLLGLGRMGRALATRLTERGHPVTTWTRSGGGTAASAVEAVAGAEVVLLCLYDGPACRAVLDEVRPALPAGAVVVNTATVSPAEATELAALVPGTVHVPVLGSTGPAAAGTLTLLVGGTPGPAAAAALADLGTALPCGTPAQAAAAKLVANGALADALLAVRTARTRAAALGLDPTLTLDLLEHTTLGGLVRAKRDRLADPTDDREADFAAAALAKDVALLAAALHPGADVAGLVTDPAVLAPLHDYAAGHATGDPSYHRRAFLPTAHVEGLRAGAFTSWTLDEYCALFTGAPAPDEARRRRRIDQVSVTGSTATATMTLHHGPDVFTDSFVLLRVDGAWRIANKTYHRQV